MDCLGNANILRLYVSSGFDLRLVIPDLIRDPVLACWLFKVGDTRQLRGRAGRGASGWRSTTLRSGLPAMLAHFTARGNQLAAPKGSASNTLPQPDDEARTARGPRNARFSRFSPD